MKKKIIIIIKIIMMLLTVVYSVLMTCLAGAGLIHNGESYGVEISSVGTALIISGVLMTMGAVLCLFRKGFVNVISIICSGTGIGLCMAMLYKLCSHADRAGWSDNYTMLPVSEMYMERIMPVIVPAVTAVIMAAIQITEARQKKKQEESKPAPKIIDD